jgi:hypothetical protein
LIFLVYLGLFILGEILFCTKVFCFHEAVNLIDVVRHFAQINELDMGITKEEANGEVVCGTSQGKIL